MNLREALIRPEVRALKAYHVADSSGLVKLDAMENPYGWPAEIVADWLDTLRDCALNRYPDPRAHALKDALRAAMAIPEQYDLLLGNGSDEIIQLLMLAVAAPGRSVLAPEPGFIMYRLISAYAGLRYVGVPLTADGFALDRAAMLAAIEQHRPALTFLAYPNNPTGNLFDANVARDIITASPGLVIVDEAYLPFAGETLLGLMAEHDNLLIMRTLSKLGLAGLRVGLLIGRRDWLDEFDKLRLPYNLNILSQASAVFALRHQALLDEQAATIRAARAALSEKLRALPGLTVYPSQANFILFRTPRARACTIFAALKRQGVLIKNLDDGGVHLDDCLRVTVGTPDENQRFLAALQVALRE
jgi:histidinol-phosphate aminotransferase